jgi:hypothetical protein
MSVDSGDVDPRDGRDETLNERMDRNWIELLQETRITQTGTQILSGFLLTIVFQPTFSDLPAFDKGLYLALVVVSTLSAATALAPVHLHRSLFRHHSKPVLVQASHLLLRAALVGFVLVMVGAVLLIVDVATGDRMTAFVTTGAVALVLLGMGLLPALVRRDRVRRWLERSTAEHPGETSRPR